MPSTTTNRYQIGKSRLIALFKLGTREVALKIFCAGTFQLPVYDFRDFLQTLRECSFKLQLLLLFLFVPQRSHYVDVKIEETIHNELLASKLDHKTAYFLGFVFTLSFTFMTSVAFYLFSWQHSAHGTVYLSTGYNAYKQYCVGSTEHSHFGSAVIRY
jgi:hypothetical protein